MADFKLHVNKESGLPGYTLLEVEGAVDALSMHEFSEALEAQFEGGGRHFIIDFQRVNFINSSGLGALVRFVDQLESTDGSFVLIRVQPQVGMVMDLLGLKNFFRVFDTLEDAQVAIRDQTASGKLDEAAATETGDRCFLCNQFSVHGKPPRCRNEECPASHRPMRPCPQCGRVSRLFLSRSLTVCLNPDCADNVDLPRCFFCGKRSLLRTDHRHQLVVCGNTSCRTVLTVVRRCPVCRQTSFHLKAGRCQNPECATCGFMVRKCEACGRKTYFGETPGEQKCANPDCEIAYPSIKADRKERHKRSAGGTSRVFIRDNPPATDEHDTLPQEGDSGISLISDLSLGPSEAPDAVPEGDAAESDRQGVIVVARPQEDAANGPPVVETAPTALPGPDVEPQPPQVVPNGNDGQGGTHHLPAPPPPASSPAAIAERAKSSANASDEHLSPLQLNGRVVVIGGGNWGSATAKLVAENLRERPALRAIDPNVTVYIHPEDVQGQPLAEVVNKYHQNVKYLPGVLLPDTVRATSDLAAAVEGAGALILTTPHEFLIPQLEAIDRHLTTEQRRGLIVLNLAKGLHYDAERNYLWRMSELAAETLKLPPQRVGALSGPNVASEIAQGNFTETVIASSGLDTRRQFRALFEKEWFAIRESTDVAGVEFGGALKNLVAIAAGFIDGFGQGTNAKATVIRLGMEEMYRFASLPNWAVRPLRETFDGPAFLGDVITTCFGGRNRKLGEAYGQAFKTGVAPMSVQDFEARVLGGQIAQGYHTAIDVQAFLASVGQRDAFPIFHMVHEALVNKTNPAPHFLTILNQGERRV